MKTIKILVTVVAVAIVAIATAVEKPKMELIALSANRAMVSVTNESPALFEMSIETKNGDLIYYKKTTSASTEYQKIYDFNNLEKGKYVLNLKVNNTKVTRDFEVNNKEILVGDSKMKFDPYFSFKDNVLKLSYMNFDREYYTVSIYNEDELFFTQSMGKNFTLQKGFDLSKLEKGNYRVVLRSLSNEYVYSLAK